MPGQVTLDAADLAAESRFQAGVLGGEVDEDCDWHRVQVGSSADGRRIVMAVVGAGRGYSCLAAGGY